MRRRWMSVLLLLLFHTLTTSAFAHPRPQVVLPLPQRMPRACCRTRSYELRGSQRSVRSHPRVTTALRCCLLLREELGPGPRCVWIFLLVGHATRLYGLLKSSPQNTKHHAQTHHHHHTQTPKHLLPAHCAAAHDLNDRIQQHAAAYRIVLQAPGGGNSLVASVGRWLDRGINAIMGGADAAARASSVEGDRVRRAEVWACVRCGVCD